MLETSIAIAVVLGLVALIVILGRQIVLEVAVLFVRVKDSQEDE